MAIWTHHKSSFSYFGGYCGDHCRLQSATTNVELLFLSSSRRLSISMVCTCSIWAFVAPQLLSKAWLKQWRTHSCTYVNIYIHICTYMNIFVHSRLQYFARIKYIVDYVNESICVTASVSGGWRPGMRCTAEQNLQNIRRISKVGFLRSAGRKPKY